VQQYTHRAACIPARARANMGAPCLPIGPSRAKRALVAGVADDGGFGFSAIAKAMAEAGASHLCGGHLAAGPLKQSFENLLRRGKMDESRRLLGTARCSSSSASNSARRPPYEIRFEGRSRGRPRQQALRSSGGDFFPSAGSRRSW